MSRKTYVLRNGELIEKVYANPLPSSPQIMRDIDDFQSLATKDKPWITSRSHLREYCKRHNLVHFGNDLRMKDFNIWKE